MIIFESRLNVCLSPRKLMPPGNGPGLSLLESIEGPI